MGSGKGPALPTFFVIGAAKCGTTSLHRYLDMHPEIGMSRIKEPHYFSVDRQRKKGEAWYMSLFDASYDVRGESSVGYTLAPHRLGVPARIKAAVPEARLVYVIRDPVARFVSDYVHMVSDGREKRPIEEAALGLANTRQGDRGRYHYQIQVFLEHFPRERLHVFTSEALAARRRETLADLFEFLEVDRHVWGPPFEQVLHESRHFRRKGVVGSALQKLGNSKLISAVPADTRREIGKVLYRPFSRAIRRPELSSELREHVIDFYRDDVAALREFLGDPLSDWSL